MDILGKISTHLPPAFSLLKSMKREYLYLFYHTMRVQAVAFPGKIYLLIKIPLKGVQSSCAIYVIIPSALLQRHLETAERNSGLLSRRTTGVITNRNRITDLTVNL
jgi:hypothetical protein